MLFRGSLSSSDSCASGCPQHMEEFPVVSTFNGPVRGRNEGGIATFRGIRYGAPPVGQDRFKLSRRPHPWTEPADAFSFGASALQMPMGLADSAEPSPIRDALAPILPPPSTGAPDT